jgi:hypothetical protein
MRPFAFLRGYVMADNVVFYRGPRHGQSMRLIDNTVGRIYLPVRTGRICLGQDGKAFPELLSASYKRTKHMLSGDRRIFQYENTE